MPIEVFEAIAALLAMLGLGTFTLLGMKMWLRAKTERERAVPKQEVERLREAVESLHEESRMIREEFAELYERVEFAERMLTRGQQIPSKDEEPSTPV